MNEKEILLEQYKLYVEMADRISIRRAQTNKFYITLLTGLLAILTCIVEKDVFSQYRGIAFLAVAVLGIVLNIVWLINIASYRQLNTGKFTIIQRMEKQLPFACYTEEWNFLGEGEDSKKYLQLTRVEKYVPYIFGLPYLLLLIFTVL